MLKYLVIVALISGLVLLQDNSYAQDDSIIKRCGKGTLAGMALSSPLVLIVGRTARDNVRMLSAGVGLGCLGGMIENSVISFGIANYNFSITNDLSDDVRISEVNYQITYEWYLFDTFGLGGKYLNQYIGFLEQNKKNNEEIHVYSTIGTISYVPFGINNPLVFGFQIGQGNVTYDHQSKYGESLDIDGSSVFMYEAFLMLNWYNIGIRLEYSNKNFDIDYSDPYYLNNKELFNRVDLTGSYTFPPMHYLF